MTTVEMAINQGCKAFICSNKIYNRYLYYFLKNSIRLLQFLGKGSTFSEISISQLKNLQIPIPSLSKQKQIVAYLDSLSEKIRQLKELQNQTAHELSLLRQSVLDKVFKGRL
ncbi:MAG: hypothetical protein DRH33_01470 [Candidatus Nealsonbacteria bacterium]|nr:MAG: hypothetical protein DRH33_01470 [Candidatus Nealsonbacteria bacterium]